MKNILQIYPRLDIIGGVERYMELFYSIYSKSFQIHNLYFYSSKIELELGENIYTLNEELKTNLALKIKRIFSRAYNIANFSRKYNINISISHGEMGNIANTMSKIFGNKAKIIILIHGPFEKKYGFFANLLHKIFYKYADKILVVSKELAFEINKSLEVKKSITLYNPFDFKIIENLKNEKVNNDFILDKLNNGKINFGCISRVAIYKQHDKLIEYFYEYYSKNNKNIQLFFIGQEENIEFKEKLLNIIKNYGLENNIFFLGHQENVFKFINKLDYGLSLFSTEGFGRVLIDMICLGVPVLTHDYKFGAKEIIRNNNNLSECKDIEIYDNGIITPFNNKQKFIEGIDLLLKTKFDKEKMRKNVQKYNIENFIEEWDKILK